MASEKALDARTDVYLRAAGARHLTTASIARQDRKYATRTRPLWALPADSVPHIDLQLQTQDELASLLVACLDDVTDRQMYSTARWIEGWTTRETASHIVPQRGAQTSHTTVMADLHRTWALMQARCSTGEWAQWQNMWYVLCEVFGRSLYLVDVRELSSWPGKKKRPRHA